MSALSIQPTYPIFTDIDGQPLESGYVWIGTANLDPQVNPTNVYWDAALTIAAVQPIRTIGGYPAKSGTPARVYVDSDYSIRVMNKNGSVVYSAPAATERYSDVVIGDINASTVIYDPAGTAAVQTTVQAALRRTVSVLDFGTGQSAWDAAIAYAIANNVVLDVTGTHNVNSVVIDGADNLTLSGSCTLNGSSTGTYDGVLVIKNSVGVATTGKIIVNAAANPGYTAAVSIFSNSLAPTSNINLANITVYYAALAWKIGSEAWPRTAISEICINGGFIFQCTNNILVVGTETVAFFNNYINVNTGTSGGFLIKSKGAYVGFNSGECVLPVSNTGAAFVMEPLDSVGPEGIPYGSIVVTNAILESASQHLVVQNPNALVVTGTSARFSITNCTGYHPGNSFSMMTVAADYAGRIVVENNNFYAGVPRTQANITCLGAATNVFCDDSSYGTNYVQGLSGISGGIRRFSNRQILLASGSTTALVSNVLTDVVFSALLNNQDTVNFGANYSTTTGVFTVPPGGLRSVNVTASLLTNQPTFVLDMLVILNGTTLGDSASTMMGGAGNSGIIKVSTNLGNLTAGTTVQIKAIQYGTASTVTGQNSFTISALN